MPGSTHLLLLESSRLLRAALLCLLGLILWYQPNIATVRATYGCCCSILNLGIQGSCAEGQLHAVMPTSLHLFRLLACLLCRVSSSCASPLKGALRLLSLGWDISRQGFSALHGMHEGGFLQAYEHVFLLLKNPSSCMMLKHPALSQPKPTSARIMD
jgi:hypothetical protein